MKRGWWAQGAIGTGILLLMAAQAVADELDEFTMDESEATVITSTRLTFDQLQQYALFEENVVVNDPSLHLVADRLTVFFTDENQAESIEAVGNVVIEQEDTTAWAQKATYDVTTGKIFLEGSPRIRRGRDILEGDTITFWRDDNRMICEPQARLVLFPGKDADHGGARGLMLGE